MCADSMKPRETVGGSFRETCSKKRDSASRNLAMQLDKNILCERIVYQHLVVPSKQGGIFVDLLQTSRATDIDAFILRAPAQHSKHPS